MEIKTYEHDNKLYYKLEKYDEALENTFKNHGYVKTDNAYIKSFPAAFPYRDKILSNFIKNAEAMFYEEAGLKPMKWREGLESFASIAREHHLDWWTTGRILLPLNGIDIEINDVDFYFQIDDLKCVYEAYADYIIEPVVSDTWRANTFKYYGLAYCNCPICLFVGPLAKLDIPEPVHFGPYASKNLVSVNWDGYTIKVPPIELYIKTLKSWGKTKDAEFITNALNLTKH